MFNIDFYNFIKDENSTKRPTGSPATYPCEIKKSSGLVSPTIELNIGLTTAPAWNYCYIADFNRYYFIDEWTFELGFWTASLSCDALATYRTEIGSADLYALRSSAVYDGRIPDTLYPTKVNCSFVSNTLTPFWLLPDPQSLNGVFILGCVSEGGLFDFGSVRYYAMAPSDMYNLCRYLLSDDLLNLNGFDPQDAALELQKSIIDPLQYIKSCVFLPLEFPTITPVLSDTKQQVKVFSWDILDLNDNPLTAYRVYNFRPTFNISKQIPIPKHPQTNSRGNYVNQSPYTNLTLDIPPFGVIELDTTVTCNASNIDIEVLLDLPTGLGILDVKCNGIVLNSITSQIGIPVQLTQITRDYLGGVTSIINGVSGTIGSALSGNIGGAISSAATGIGNAIQSLTPRSQSIGTGGSYAQLFSEPPRLDAQFFEIVDDDIAKNGRPCCKIVNCKNNPGYYLIQDGDIAMGGTHSEAQIVKGYLESGFYWE